MLKYVSPEFVLWAISLLRRLNPKVRYVIISAWFGVFPQNWKCVPNDLPKKQASIANLLLFLVSKSYFEPSPLAHFHPKDQNIWCRNWISPTHNGLDSQNDFYGVILLFRWRCSPFLWDPCCELSGYICVTKKNMLQYNSSKFCSLFFFCSC